jgi:hypothetical protein
MCLVTFHVNRHLNVEIRPLRMLPVHVFRFICRIICGLLSPDGNSVETES